MTMSLGLAVALPVACWLATSVRLVARGQRVVVTRRGVVQRVYDDGVALRVPLLEGFERQPVELSELPLMVRATTCDDIRVLVLAEVTVAPPRPVLGTPYADPWPRAEATAEEAVGRLVAERSSDELMHSPGTALRPLWHTLSTAVDQHGVTLLELELVEVDVQLDEDALDRGRP